MIGPTAKLSVSRQAKVLGISRGSVCYRPRPVPDADLKLMHRIDRLHMELPFAGSRMLQGLLVQEAFKAGRLHAATLMKRMGIEALYRKPNASKPAPGHKIFPYLLRELPVSRPNQVWAMDITDIPMARGFIYLAAVVDWFTRRVLAWRVSITLETAFCIEAAEEALARHGAPEIFNTDQGSQFTSTGFIKVLAAREIRISMDGKGAWRVMSHRRENVIALGPSGTGKTHAALGLGLAACQKGRKVRFTTAAALVHELIEAADDRRLQRLQKALAAHDLLIIDELGFVPLSKTGAELLFEVISQRYERGSIIITSNLPFDEWTEVFGSVRLTGAILDRLTHHVHILEMNGESFRLRQSRTAKS